MQQHALDVGMDDFQIGGLVGLLRRRSGRGPRAAHGHRHSRSGRRLRRCRCPARPRPAAPRSSSRTCPPCRRRTSVSRRAWAASGLGPSRQAMASSKFSTQVAWPLMPILCSMPPVLTPLRRAHLAVFIHQEFRHHEEIHGGKIVMDLRRSRRESWRSPYG